MSQHILKTTDVKGASVQVRIGYDRPLDYIHCTVTDQDGEITYSSLGDVEALIEVQDVDYYRPILADLGITVPDTIFDEVSNDQASRVGNRVVIYEARVDGSFTTLETHS